MYACNSRKSFDELDAFRTRVQEVVGRPNPRIVVVGNKVDLAAAREVTEDAARSWAESISAPWLECSAKENVSIEHIFEKSLEQLTGEKLIPKKVKPPKDPKKDKKKNKGGCLVQ
jgi:GTPase SAR1 family protein